MASLFDSDIPPWLRTGPEKAPWEALLEGSHAGSQIASNILHARSIQMQAEEQTAQVGNVMASTELKRQQLQETNEQNAAWLKVAEPVSKWLMTPDDKLDQIPTPDVGTSEKAVQFIEKRRQAKDLNDYRREMNGIKRDNARIALDNQKQSVDWNNAVGSSPASVQAEILSKPNQGWVVDQQGRKLTPTTEALAIYDKWATGDGQNPDRAFGYKSNPVTAAKVRTEGQLATEDKRQEGRVGLEEQRQADRKELAGIAQTYKVDLEKLKSSIKVQTGAKSGPSENEFINRQYGRVLTELEKNWDHTKNGPYSVEKASHAALTLLKGLYKEMKAQPAIVKNKSAEHVSPSEPATVFTDKSGKQFKYKGSASDPSTDKDPSHWEMIP